MAGRAIERLQTSDLDEIVDVVAGVYCDHAIEIVSRRAEGGAARFERLGGSDTQPIVHLQYGRQVRVDAGGFPRLLLMQTCLDGSGLAQQGALTAQLKRGQTIPLSPALSTHLSFDARFSQRSVRLNIESAEALCSRWLNAPLDRPLRFDLRPFSDALERAWVQAVDMIADHARNGIVLPSSAVAHLDEFLVSLVLAQHTHNYSQELLRPRPRMAPRLIREAEHLMRTASIAQTPSKIAAELKVSLRSLEVGFRETHDCTPLEFLRKIRLAKARDALLAPQDSTSVTGVALENGFLHLARFSAYYKDAFGELPIQTLRRRRPSRTP